LERAGIEHRRGLAGLASRRVGWVANRVHVAYVKPVEEVKRIADDLHIPPLAKGNLPGNAQIEFSEAWPSEGISTQIARAAERRRNGVWPQRHCLVANSRQCEVHAGYIRRLHSYRADGRAIRIAAEIQVVVGAGQHGKRPAGRELNNWGNGQVGQDLCAKPESLCLNGLAKTALVIERVRRSVTLATLRFLCHDGAAFMRWIIPTVNPETIARLAGGQNVHLNLSPLLARLLVLRGVDQAAQVEPFLHPKLSSLHDPFLMAGMSDAVERLRRAIEHREKILIYGDYDVDGTMAVVVLLTAMGSLGAQVDAYIPNRLTDGYGMRVPVVEKAAAEGVRVIISVDTGIREHEVIARARDLNVDTIVTDHHVPEGRLPPALAILNPKRPECAYPDKNLAGVGVAFKLAQGLFARLRPGLSEKILQSYLKIVAIGTIADVVPLVGENRIIARFGLEGLARPSHVGLRALMDVAGLNGKVPSAGDVAFRLAPRLNAAGRMENARDVIDLFTTDDDSLARSIAERLNRLNQDRQRTEEQILDEVVAIVERDPQRAERYSLVFAGEGWHRGVIGIVAQRAVEKYHRPSLVIGIEQGVGQGSGRSITGFNLLSALTHVSDLFERFGGHAAAAGFTLPAGRIGELERRLEEYARATLSPQDLEPTVRVDAEVALDEITNELYESLCEMEPFGIGNPAPVFGARNLSLVDPPRVLKEKHLKLRVSANGQKLDALMWRGAGKCPPLVGGQKVDAAFAVEQNTFQERTTLQLVPKDIQVRK
jgi:single-stranded-DNA-specific exonuclease